MIKHLGLTLGCFAIAMLGACSSSGGSHHGGGNYGNVSDAVVHLYDTGTAAGTMEIRADRGGSIYYVETDVAPHQIPKMAIDAAFATTGGGTITGARFAYGADDMTYEIRLMKDDVAWEVMVDEMGEVVGTEQQIRRQDAPMNIIDNALAALPGHFKSVELVTEGDHVSYHIKTQDGMASYKAVVGVDGTVWSAVREARAELEIPLAP